jgi:hypothetical protein
VSRAWLGGAIVIIVCIGIGGVVAVVVSLILCTDEEKEIKVVER